MKEIPMLFSTPMIQAILQGRKTMTRRIMKPQIKDCNHSLFTEAEWRNLPTQWSEAALKIGRAYCACCGNGVEHSKDNGGIKCPYGQPGDLLWCRETWAPDLAGDDVNSYIEYIRYVADGTRLPIKWVKDYGRYSNRPGIHMNKEYARIWLQKTASKVERACDISREDAIAEGLACITKDGGRTWKYGIPDSDGLPGTDDHGWPWQEWEIDPVAAFKKLWCKINGPETWESWVWCESFAVLSTTGKPLLTEKTNA